MKRYLTIFTMAKRLLFIGITIGFALPLASFAAPVALATSPLATSTVSKVKPNVMFILDDSGSMDWDYLPDWANDNDPSTGNSYTSTPERMRNAGFNGLAYNPAIVYTPPVFYNTDGTLNTIKYLTQNGTSASATGVNGQGGGTTTTPRWTSVKNDAYGIQSTSSTNLEVGASYYVFITGEYCSTDRMTSCVTATAPTTLSGVLYNKPAGLRWCDSVALTNCQIINDATFNYPRYPGLVSPVAALSPTSTITINTTTGGCVRVSSLTVGGTETLTSTTQNSNCTSPSQLANRIRGRIGSNGFSATGSNNEIIITAPAGTTYNNAAITMTISQNSATWSYTTMSGGTAASSITIPGSNVLTSIASGTNSYPYPGSAAKAPTRIDCAGTTCTYNEEMTNYANWWTYYRTRMQSMKTSVSRAFKTIDDKFRVGFSTISSEGATNGKTIVNNSRTSGNNVSTYFLGNNTFELAHKNTWYTMLFSGDPSISTPLRGALSKAGRYYGNKISGQVDPIQYSCQQNFTILSTDGYWNTGYETSGYTALDLVNNAVGNQDDATTTTDKEMREGATAVSDTLADIAMYYYETDLRTGSADPAGTGQPTLNNCAGAVSTDFPSGNSDVCTDNVFKSSTDNINTQHMTTFTMGLGADGTLVYTPDYKDATSGDYYDLSNGLGSPTVRWSDPTNSGAERIDDLWHAAVNGRGLYFSAKDPNQIIAGFSKALKSINAKLGAAAAAATSTLNPVAGNNSAFVASYTTVKWTGNLEARAININTGAVDETATWCVEDIPDASSCPSTGSIVVDTSGASKVYNCVVPNSTAAACAAPSVFNSSTLECKTEVQKSCDGKMSLQVGSSTDTRNIYTAPSGGMTALSGQNLVPFDASYATANPSNFSAATISTLPQWSSLTGPGAGTQQDAAVGVNLVNYLRGRSSHEDILSNSPANRLYRAREAVLGDALESQPAFMGPPVFSYTYPGYTAFKTGTAATRPGIVYMGTNDGMMHAFYAKDQTTATPCVISTSNYCGGQEAWAYVPSMVIPNMWKLASTNYDTNHINFVNGSPITSDICTANCTNAATAVWKTILVGGLNGGERGYYALDITDPTTPKLLWEFTTMAGVGAATGFDDNDLGFSYGQPIITKKVDGTWVVIVTSGYNNVSPGNGQGYLYVLNANTGAIISKTSTGAGDTTTPSGLAKIAGWNDDPAGNTVGFVYGGDLEGNLWRFDINTCTVATPSTCDVMKLAKLYSTSAGTAGTEQPITTAPVLGSVSGYRVVFVGTGKYLEAGDLNAVNASAIQQQTQYAIKDSNPAGTTGTTNTIVNPRTTLVQQILGNPNAQSERLVTSSNGVNFSTNNGWYVDFPAAPSGTPSERVNIDSQLVEGTLIVPTIIPSNTACSPGGIGWLNFFDYKTGRGVTSSGIVSSKYDSTIVGVNIIYIDGKPKVSVVTSTNPTPELNNKVLFSGSAGSFTGKRTLWRELIQ